MRPQMRCLARDCAQEFRDEHQFRLHCAEHVDAIIAADRALRRIHLPAETWTGVFQHCDQESLLERMCFSGRLFHEISRHLLDRPNGRVLPELTFSKSPKGNFAILAKEVANGKGKPQQVEVPIAEVAPPPTVVGFSRITVKYFDAKVLSFLCAIWPLLDNACLELVSDGPRFQPTGNPGEYSERLVPNRHNVPVLELILRAFPRLAFTTLHIDYGNIDGSISTDLWSRLLLTGTNNMSLLNIHCKPPVPKTKLLTGGCCTNCSQHIPVLAQWLHSPTGDGHQRVASMSLGEKVNFGALVALAEQYFTTSTTPISYFVCVNSREFRDSRTQLPFDTLRNELNEVLILRHYPHFSFHCNGLRHNFVLFRRNSSTTNEEDELTAMQSKLSTLFRPNGPKLVLKVLEMGSKIDESLFPLDKEEHAGQQGDNKADQQASQPSSAKKIRLDSGE